MTVASTLLGGNRAFGRGYIDGLILANGTDADHDINIAAGECRDSTNTYNLINTATLVKQIDAAWAAGSAAGGLFSGAVGNATWYHVFLIRKDVDGTIDAGFDTSVTAANKPAGYSTYRRIGSVLTNGSANIIAFKQLGDRFIWKAYARDFMGTSPTSTTLFTISTPLGIVTMGFGCLYTATAAAAYYHHDADAQNQNIYAVVGQVTGQYNANGWLCKTDTSSRINHDCTQAVTCISDTLGWIDPRGRDS